MFGFEGTASASMAFYTINGVIPLKEVTTNTVQKREGHILLRQPSTEPITDVADSV